MCLILTRSTTEMPTSSLPCKVEVSLAGACKLDPAAGCPAAQNDVFPCEWLWCPAQCCSFCFVLCSTAMASFHMFLFFLNVLAFAALPAPYLCIWCIYVIAGKYVPFFRSCPSWSSSQKLHLVLFFEKISSIPSKFIHISSMPLKIISFPNCHQF